MILTAHRPLTAKDIPVIIDHLIGIDPHSTLIDWLNRQTPLLHDGEIDLEMLA